MASLKEIKGRINSVNSTRKITSAMKMIASSKLHKAQAAIVHFLPYQKQLDAILTNLLAAETDYDSAFTERRSEVKKIAIVVFSSNTTLCGAYNVNVIKELRATIDSKQSVGKENILVYPVGKQVAEAVKKAGLTPQGDFSEMADKPSFAEVQKLAKELIAKYTARELDEISLIYHHFKSMGTQILVNEPYLPFDLSPAVEADTKSDKKTVQADYIYEPSKVEILESLIPTVLYSRLYAALLDSNASEHAARTMAMQIATDNANDLIQELNIQYNKTRQYAVTSELLDIMGGVSAMQ